MGRPGPLAELSFRAGRRGGEAGRPRPRPFPGSHAHSLRAALPAAGHPDPLRRQARPGHGRPAPGLRAAPLSGRRARPAGPFAGLRRVHQFHGHNGLELRLVFDDQRLPLTRRVGDVVSPGIYLRNSEVGLGCLALECFILRLVCKNGLVVAKDNTFYRWRQVAVRPERAVAELRRAVDQVADQAVEAARLLDQAAERRVRGGARGP